MSPFRVKVCGVTTPADAAFAAECGADAVGLNFYPPSPRFLAPDTAAAVAAALPATCAAVGLFVAAPDAEVRATADRVGLAGVQTYPETADPPGFPTPFVPAFRVKGEASLAFIRRVVAALRAAGRPPAAVLVDAHVPGRVGGTGHVAPWHLLAGFDPGVPLILAGGLTPDTVAAAVAAVRPWGVDVASGVEAAPGRKDPGKVRAFVRAARAALGLDAPPPAVPTMSRDTGSSLDARAGGGWPRGDGR